MENSIPRSFQHPLPPFEEEEERKPDLHANEVG